MKIKENNKLGLININRLLKCNFTKKVLRGPFSIPTRLGCYVKRNRSGQMNRATSKEHEAQIPHHRQSNTAKISHEQLRSARDPNTHSPTPSANHVHIYIVLLPPTTVSFPTNTRNGVHVQRSDGGVQITLGDSEEDRRNHSRSSSTTRKRPSFIETIDNTTTTTTTSSSSSKLFQIRIQQEGLANRVGDPRDLTQDHKARPM